jgi:hypothetical protein
MSHQVLVLYKKDNNFYRDIIPGVLVEKNLDIPWQQLSPSTPDSTCRVRQKKYFWDISWEVWDYSYPFGYLALPWYRWPIYRWFTELKHGGFL